MNVAERDGARESGVSHGSTVLQLARPTRHSLRAHGLRQYYRRDTMADKDTPNRAANKDKAEGERWTSEEGVIPNSESSTDRRYSDENRDNAGGITNRGIGEEIDNQ